MRRLKMIVSYDGTAYSGFQTQPHGNTIQDKLELAVKLLTGDTVKVVSSGRTDAGVHARGQVIHFDTESRIPAERWAIAMNSRLPDDIVVLEAQEVDQSFHARYSAKTKTYAYTINNNKFPDVMRRKQELHHPRPLDWEAMREALRHLEGEHDFTSFCSARSTQASHVRTIYRTRIDHLGDRHPDYQGVYRIFVTGNGFLYNMVRMIVGTLIEVGEGRRSSSEIPEILEARNPMHEKLTAMAHGLTLWEVRYDSGDGTAT
ncbi:tRNA pseudouridine(38-40) synthase TruA [Paenibacillus thermoaerophilus]|uniref:tRNA pseudouridine synthase A n=1 Tax=Paenibacillus thermoaerophilus TaxID=1215385 RepID=A0ABW2V1M7_9BACL|nr:tRNA pseudouridine(38-40) synthase TruA [Paenibacillus thermoaerophilus]TMV10938.1 tRNA pseudouridine(38-40) synthase TruA [Paenibacillus thermoaerophilus]